MVFGVQSHASWRKLVEESQPECVEGLSAAVAECRSRSLARNGASHVFRFRRHR